MVDVFQEGYYADRVIERSFKNNPKWGAKDRRFFAETAYGCVRWWGKLWFLIGKDIDIHAPVVWQVIGAYLLTSGGHEELPKWEEWKLILFVWRKR